LITELSKDASLAAHVQQRRLVGLLQK